MTLTDDDKDWIKKAVVDGVVEGINQVVIPKFEELEKKVDDLTENVSGIQKDVARLEKKTDKIAELLTDTRTNHERRIRKLEEEAGIESPTLAL